MRSFLPPRLAGQFTAATIRAILIIVALWALGQATRFVLFGSDAYGTLAKLQHQQTYDTKGIQFFAIVTPEGEALLSVDGDLPLSKWLLEHADQKISITVESAELQTVER
jgi:hypothetical protein